ncbi:MAG: nucleotidyltransferase family protein [Phycisphaerales bacterium]|jgi:predicted nucleotidyltransferase|nr:nucleotidyltransferase family protein [Phycisphaerales bacterium]
MDAPTRITVPKDKISDFCHRWKISELSLFGSVLREDFDPVKSDVDVLVSFVPDAPWSLWEIIEMRDELTEIFGREVDLIEKDGLRNPFRKHEILNTRQVVYAA